MGSDASFVSVVPHLSKDVTLEDETRTFLVSAAPLSPGSSSCFNSFSSSELNGPVEKRVSFVSPPVSALGPLSFYSIVSLNTLFFIKYYI